MQQALETRTALESDLRLAIKNQQLQLFYQVQIDQNLKPLGAEALIRWFHPQRGMTPPGQFIPVAEESSLILEIGHWVLDHACQQLAIWNKNPQTQNLVLAVNVSAMQFKQLNFVEQVKTAIRMHDIVPSSLKLELTESVALENLEAVISKMHILREEIGVQLSLDDFGTGYSSLSYLKLLPLNQIKIDQSFVRDVTIDNNDAVMVITIIELAKNFGLEVIAEGVETDAHLAFLREHGCKAYQGYLFSKPLCIQEFEGLINTV
jgi:EAL domain-containing protein (putative c-di-GMP-specific phosphodiesterase class I)